MSNDDVIAQLAEMRREIASLKEQRVTYRSGTVVARDTDASTFTADVDGVGEVAGLAIDLEHLPAVGDTVRLQVAGATPLYRPNPPTINAVTPEGIPYEVAKLGQPSGITDADGNTIWQVDENGRETVQDFSVNGDPILMGTPFTEHIAPLASFHAGASRGALIDPAQTTSTGGETGLFECTVEFEPGIEYEINTSNIWVRPSQTTCTRIDVNIRYAMTGTRGATPPSVSLASPYFMRWVQAVDAAFSLTGHGVRLGKLFKVNAYSHYRFLLSLESFGGGAFIEMGSGNHSNAIGQTIEPEAAQIYVSNGGAHPWTNRAQTNTGSGTPAAVIKEVRTYTATWTRRFREDGTTLSSAGLLAAQGYNPKLPDSGDQKTQVGGFELSGVGIGTDLAGATVEKLELRLYAQHWLERTGGTAIIHYHNNATAGTWSTVSAAEIQVPDWGRGQERWVDITDWADEFLALTAKGIAVGPSGGTDPLYYGVFHGHTAAYPPQIRATLTR